jgi:hypothetical protein
MVKKGFLLLLLLLPFFTFSQEGDKVPIRIEGKIVDSLSRPVSYAHILVRSRNTGWVGGYDGTFKIGVYPGDTLTISAVSFHKINFIVPESLQERDMPLVLLMDQDTIILSEQVIYPWPETYQELKKDILEMKVEDPLANLDLHLPSPQELKMISIGTGPYGVAGPFSLLYDRYSKEAKAKRLMQENKLKEKVEARYNSTVVARITGLTDEEEIIKLIEFCSLDTKFILDSTDYELYSAILFCYNDYSRQTKP